MSIWPQKLSSFDVFVKKRYTLRALWVREWVCQKRTYPNYREAELLVNAIHELLGGKESFLSMQYPLNSNTLTRFLGAIVLEILKTIKLQETKLIGRKDKLILINFGESSIFLYWCISLAIDQNVISLL